MDIVENFILNLPVKPLCFQLVGSRAKGTNRPDSDWDVAALYERDNDIPIDWIMENMDEDGLFSGKVDFQYFAKDWTIFQVHPELLEELFAFEVGPLLLTEWIPPRVYYKEKAL